MSVTISGIDDYNYSWVYVGIYPVNDPSTCLAWGESCECIGEDEYFYPEITLNYTVQSHDELMVFVEYNRFGNDYPEIELSHDRLDLDLKVTSITNPTPYTYYSSRDNPPTINFQVQNVGSDNIPPVFTSDVTLYSAYENDCWFVTGYQDYQEFTFSEGNTKSISMPITNPSWDDNEAVVAIVDEYDYYEEDYYGTDANNCLHLADIYWDFCIDGYLEYFDWDSWPGPPDGVSSPNEYAENIKVELLDANTSNVIATEYTDDWGYYEFQFPQSYLSCKFRVTFNRPNQCTVVRDITNDQVVMYSDIFDPRYTWQVDMSTMDNFPDQSNDEYSNGAINAIFTLDSTKAFLTRQLGYNYTIPFSVRFQLRDDYNPAIGTYYYSTHTINTANKQATGYYYIRTLQHELGHMIHFYAHGSHVASNCPSPHSYALITNETCAYTEGWAHFFRTIIPDDDIYAATRYTQYGGANYMTESIEENDWAPDPAANNNQYLGQQVEGTFASILYDLYDYNSDLVPDHDDIYIPFSHLYNALSANSTLEFANNLSYQGQKFCDLLIYQWWDPAFIAGLGCDPTSVLEQDDNDLIPVAFKVDDGYPNPFNSSFKIRFDIPHRGNVDVSLVNILGRKIFSETLEQVGQGSYTYGLDFENIYDQRMATGVYLLKVTFENTTVTKKMNYLK